MFELVENRLYAYADDSTLLAVVRMPADRPAVAASLNMDLAWIQESYNQWCIILNLNQTKALVINRSRTVNPPHGDLVLSVVSICANPNFNILGMTFDSRLTFEYHVRGVVSRGYQRIGILTLVKRVFVATSLLLRCYYVFVLTILEYCSPVWESAAECHRQLLERQVYSVARLWPDKTFVLLCYLGRVSALCMLYKGNLYSNYCLFNELPSASVRVQHTERRLQLIH